MKSLQGNLAVDTSAWVEYFLETELGEKLDNYLSSPEPKKVYISLFTLSEIYYVLCRAGGEKLAEESLETLKAIKDLVIERSVDLAGKAGSLKCKRAISLADCTCISLAEKYGCQALFARKEREIEEEEKRKPFKVKLIFLEEQY
ncbi:MAG: PIN domain-containing protein [Candidatus Freyarchaeum deiterrae]